MAKQILNKSFNPKLISKMGDEDAISYLSNLRQIGRWSAEMILLFTYNRSNIWPIQDIGLLRAISKNYNKKYLPPINFVKEWITTAAPCSIGLHITGAAVLSIIRGILCFLPMSATSLIGKTRKYGFGKVSA